MEDLQVKKPDMVYCLGDLVGYNIWANEVVEIIRQQRIPTIAGNYDEGVGLNSDDCGCAYKTEEDKVRGNQSIAYTNGIISDNNRLYLRHLPRHLRLEFMPNHGQKLSVLLVHGSPRKINEYLFEDRPEKSMLRLLQDAETDIMLFGHTHKPFHRMLQDQNEDGSVRYRHAINLGSVGKPKDGDPRACYAMLHLSEHSTNSDAQSLKVKFERVPYDVELAAAAVENSPLPNAFADMLRKAY